jgi:alcohol dehydrogenase
VRGLRSAGPGRIEVVDDLPEPRLEAPTDAIVTVRASGLCGSDLHPYLGREPARSGVVPGHEAVGEVALVGDAVTTVQPGDRVLVPFTTSCGTCGPCCRGLTARCEQGQLFGWGDPDDASAPALHGAQAERLRVPLADTTLVRVPTDLDDLDAVLLTDNLPTGWAAVRRAEVAAGSPLAVVGLGSVGLCAVWAAQRVGAGPVIAIDPVATRREHAARTGVTAAHPDEALDVARDLAPGGLLAVVEAAGSASAQTLGADLLAPGGVLSLISVQTADRFGFRPVDAYDRNLTVRAGRASARAVLDELLPRVREGGWPLPTADLVTHPAVALEDGPATYERFAAREEGLLKAVFRP